MSCHQSCCSFYNLRAEDDQKVRVFSEQHSLCKNERLLLCPWHVHDSEHIRCANSPVPLEHEALINITMTKVGL